VKRAEVPAVGGGEVDHRLGLLVGGHHSLTVPDSRDTGFRKSHSIVYNDKVRAIRRLQDILRAYYRIVLARTYL
jgi:hypothetical protein